MAKQNIIDKKIVRGVISQSRNGLKAVGRNVRKASRKIVPIDNRELIDNLKISTEKAGSQSYSVVVHYGSDPVSAQYAVEQHENLQYHHAPGKSAKFLETPFTQHATLQAVANEIQKRFHLAKGKSDADSAT